MGDLDKLAEDVARKAALASGLGATKRALSDAFLSDEERAARDAAEAQQSKRRRTKLAVIAVLSLLVVVGLIGLALSYWHWFLLAGLLGLGALYGVSRFRKARAAKNAAVEEAPRPPTVTTAAAAKVVEEEAPASASRPNARELEAAIEAKRARLEQARAARARAEDEARAEAEEVDDELAALKARLKKEP